MLCEFQANEIDQSGHELSQVGGKEAHQINNGHPLLKEYTCRKLDHELRKRDQRSKQVNPQCNPCKYAGHVAHFYHGIAVKIGRKKAGTFFGRFIHGASRLDYT